MRTPLAMVPAPSMAALAVLALLALPVRVAHGGDPGTWQPLSGPWQSGGGLALDDDQHRILTWGGDGTDMVLAMTLNGYPYPWQMLTAAGTPPSIRSGHVLAFDATHDRLIVFGGVDAAGHALDDVWQLTLGGTPTWSPLLPTGTAPDPRSDFGACYDPTSGMLFVFGGLDTDGNVESNDLYALDLNASPPAWSMPTQSGALPSGRSGSPLALDPVGRRLLLFGGNDGSTDLGDEYELDLATFTWSSAPTSGMVPDPRSDHVCVYDRNSTQLLVWGGTAADDSLRALDMATRTWSSLNWFIGPPSRGGGRSLGVFDWQWNRLVVLAGDRGADAWTFWKVSPTNFWYPTGPTAAPIAGSMVVDRAHARAVTYGGLDWSTNSTMNSFWQYAFTDPKGWNGVNTGGIDPPSRAAHLAVWDQGHDRMLVIAGRDPGGAHTNTVYALQDSADFMNWKQLAPTGTPPSPRSYAAGIYDPVGDRVLLYGGIDATNIRGGLHQLALSPTPAWTTLAPASGPNGRVGASAIYDEPRRRMILFGGIDSVGNYTNDVWALNLPATTWTHLAPTGTPPAGRWKHTAVYDSRRGRMVVFGGRVSSADSADTWELSLAGTPAWTRLAPAGYKPWYRSEASAAYDSTGDRVLVYGGASLITPSLAIGQKDLWGLQFTAGVAAVDPSPTLEGPWRVSAVAPNPARGSSRLSFRLSRPAVLHAAVFDLAGRRVKGLADGVHAPGWHELSWDGRDASGREAVSGLYFYRVDLDGQVESRKVVLVR